MCFNDRALAIKSNIFSIDIKHGNTSNNNFLLNDNISECLMIWWPPHATLGFDDDATAATNFSHSVFLSGFVKIQWNCAMQSEHHDLRQSRIPNHTRKVSASIVCFIIAPMRGREHLCVWLMRWKHKQTKAANWERIILLLWCKRQCRRCWRDTLVQCVCVARRLSRNSRHHRHHHRRYCCCCCYTPSAAVTRWTPLRAFRCFCSHTLLQPTATATTIKPQAYKRTST